MAGDARSKFNRICVFCGSNSGNRTVFSDAALDLGHELVKRGINLVYGGGSVGLMGLISQTVYDGGCDVLGVIPTALMPLEISGQTVGEVKTVADMHERKAEMARQSDAFIALPGGYGTMEETLEMITWSQLGIHNKPVGLLNVDGYYNSLLALFDNGVTEGFIKPSARDIVVSAPTAKELLIKMEEYTPLHEQVAPRTSWEIAHLGGILAYMIMTAIHIGLLYREKVGLQPDTDQLVSCVPRCSMRLCICPSRIKGIGGPQGAPWSLLCCKEGCMPVCGCYKHRNTDAD